MLRTGRARPAEKEKKTGDPPINDQIMGSLDTHPHMAAVELFRRRSKRRVIPSSPAQSFPYFLGEFLNPIVFFSLLFLCRPESN